MKAVRHLIAAVLLLTVSSFPALLRAGIPAGPVEFATAGFSVSEAGTVAVITVHRIQLDGDSFTVSYSTFDREARAGEDYVATSGTVSFAPYQTNATFSVAIMDDPQFEGIETVGLVLSNPTGGATLGTHSTAVLTILDDETTAPGVLDQSFNPGAGVRGVVRSLAIEPAGRILVGGEFDQVGGVTRNGVARLNANGSLDPDFEPGLSPGARVNAVAFSPDAKIIIGGSFTSVGTTSRGGIARLREDGSLDAAFDPGTGANGEVLAVCLLPDGRVLLGGAFEAVQGVPRQGLARLNGDGSLDASFVAPVPNGVVRCLRLQEDGAILVGGSFTSMGDLPRTFVARLTAEGALDDTFDPGAGNTVHNGTGIFTLAIQSDGAVVLGGDFSILFGRGRSALMRLYPNGTVDDTFAPNVPTGDKVWSVAVQPDGRVLAGGTFSRLANPSCCDLFPRNGIARLNPDGSVDTSFDPGAGAAPQSVQALTLQRDLKVVMGGAFAEVDGRDRRGIARLTGDQALRIQRMDVMADKQVELTIIAQPDQYYVIEASADTVHWAPLATNLSQTALLNFIDKNSAVAEQRFYRVRHLAR